MPRRAQACPGVPWHVKVLLWLHRTCINQAEGKPTCTVSHLQLGRYLMGAHAYLSGHAQAYAFSSHVLACQNEHKLI